MGGHGEGVSLEFTPTWVVAGVCTIIVAISLAVERLLHHFGTVLKKKKQKPLYEALQKVKEELMLLGFISLLLTVTQGFISKFCVKEDVLMHMLPCSKHEAVSSKQHENATTTEHFQSFLPIVGTTRRLLAEHAAAEAGYCGQKGKVPLLSLEALHHLHIFIFVLAISHVTFCALTVVFGSTRIHQWKKWEDALADENFDTEAALKKKRKVTHVHQHAFIKEHFLGIGKDSFFLGWTTHCKGNPKLNFHKYMMRALEDDFKQVVGISWYLWIFVVIFLLLNVNGWHTYFWIAFIPFILLLAVGTKLEHVISQLAHEVAEKHVAIEGDLVVKPSDEHFWFSKPQAVLFLIHFILFQNAFEIAFFFWIWVTYGFDSCIMGQVRYIVPRLVIGVFIQVLCSYSTLPLYALVSQMGSNFKKAIFEENVQVGLVGWAQKVKNKRELKAAAAASNGNEGSSQAAPDTPGSGSGPAPGASGGAGFAGIQLSRLTRNNAGETQDEITPATHNNNN
ncbi:MLO-like protein 1 [Raphanus sativus]|nr:MLO-like protein 1 [Raphanus sativus]